ncbi:MAG TPA: DUF2314 domain-containing protein [Gallionellaceae bacterium]
MKSLPLPGIAIALFLLALSGCTKTPEAEGIATGPLMADSMQFQLAIYYLPTPSKNPATALNEFLTASHSKLKQVEALPKVPSEPLVSTHLLSNVQQDYAPPGMDSLNRFGRGITREQALALQKSTQALILDFAHPKADVWTGLRTAYSVTEAVARATGGLLWDEQTREMFTPDEWHKRRIASWTDEIPDIPSHTVIHAYRSGEYVRAITLGMSKFGLPDVVVEDFSWSMNSAVGNLINLFSQSIAEGATITKRGEFDLELHGVKNARVRESQTASLKPNATAIAHLSLKQGKWEEGDPKNPLIELTFNRYEGEDNHAKQDKLLSALFGWEDDIVQVKHDDQLLAASNKAKSHLPELKRIFNAGLAPGEYIEVKAPFAVPTGGNEWMWVEITAWDGDKIKGLLKNEPFQIPSLHGGQIVEVSQQDIFDYIRRYPDGKEEGNETGDILQKMQQAKDKR